MNQPVPWRLARRGSHCIGLAVRRSRQKSRAISSNVECCRHLARCSLWCQEFRMNKMERDFRPDGLAEIEYLDGEYRVVRAGSFVICAITGEKIPLEALRYWSVDLQEAY